MYNNVIEDIFGTHAIEGYKTNNELTRIIKGIPLTLLSSIQSLVVYHRSDTGQPWPDRTISLAIELYNSENDNSLENILDSTNVIETTELVYRFDFPNISSYDTSEFVDENSTTNIVSENFALTEVMSFIEKKEVISYMDETVNITGDLVVGTTNIITEIGTKQATINTGDLSITDVAGLESALNNKQDDIDATIDVNCNTLTTAGNINVAGVINTNNPFFHNYSSNLITINNTYLNYSGKVIDNYDAMDTSTGAYTIPKDGIYYFIFTIIVPSNTITFGIIYKNDTHINGKGEFANNGNNWTEASFFAYAQCSEGDIIKAYATAGRLQPDNSDIRKLILLDI